VQKKHFDLLEPKCSIKIRGVKAGANFHTGKKTIKKKKLGVKKKHFDSFEPKCSIKIRGLEARTNSYTNKIIKNKNWE